MATRSRIAIKLNDHEETGNDYYLSIYVHFDGMDVSHILKNHYSDFDVALKIVTGGDISYITEKEIKYYKDLGDSWEVVQPNESQSLEALFKLANESDAQFLNIYQDGEWQEIKLGC
ncbi:hypothetical protein [Endozoicomonas atrinae]|uniref:hypothetical protein n=1 Tax=Endozoicomonas atrinae TaxID=1333660 RepID=UPI003B00A3CA